MQQTTDFENPSSRNVTQRDLQRTALSDLVRLATECATTEDQLEQRHKAAREEADKEFAKSNRELDNRSRNFGEQIEQERQKRLEKIESQYQSEAAALDAADQAARQRIELDYKSTEREMKQRYEQAAWLAESLLEGTEAQIREDAKKAADALQTQTEGLDEAEAKARQVVTRYKQAVPHVAPSQAASASPESFDAAKAVVDAHLARLSKLTVPNLFVGIRPYLLVVVFGLLAAFAAHVAGNQFENRVTGMIAGAGGTILVGVALGVLLWFVARSQIRHAHEPLVHALDDARRAAQKQADEARADRERRLSEVLARKDEEVRKAKEKFAPVLAKAGQTRDSATEARQADYDRKLPQLEKQRELSRGDLETWHQSKKADVEERVAREREAIRQRFEQNKADTDREYQEARRALERRLHEGLTHIRAPIGQTPGNGHATLPWTDPAWNDWRPPRAFAAHVPFGDLRVDLRRIADAVPRKGPLQLALPDAFSMPASLGFPKQASLLIQHDRDGRDQAIRTLQMVMTRLLTSLPAGRARFTIIDPVGLGQSFAGFMHLADHDEALVGSRIWTEREQIEQRLADFTEHMETVIQKYLRNEFETIDDYNAQAGELAEPYRFLVIADFPIGFEEESLRRLAAIAASGARCGIYTLIAHDTRQPLPHGTHLAELEANSVTLVQDEDRFVWKDEVFRQFPLSLAPPPAEEFLNRVLDVVGKAAKEANRVEVSFDSIAPRPEHFWTASAAEDLKVPIGRMGATRLQYFRVGRGVAQHALIAGKTGSGKSTLLHAIVTNLAMWYSPDEVEFYLIDFKKGVEFKTYVTHRLPHARAIAVESDREFGLSVLQRLDAELVRRGDLYRKVGAQDLAGYRAATGAPLPRTLLMIDEFQEFFSEDDKLAQDAGLLLDRLVRQGRAFGIHIILGSQTIGGTSGLARSTIGQMAVRVALQTSEADSQIILGDNNSAARLLSRPGEAIYNDQGGLIEGNSPFQVAWLPDDRREQYLARVRALLNTRKPAQGHPWPTPVVFEGNIPADLDANPQLRQALDAPAWADTPAPRAFLGDPVAIKDPTSVVFRRQPGANALIVGQQDDSAMALLAATLLSLAAQQSPQSATFYLLDGSAADSPLARVLPKVASALPHAVKNVEYRAAGDAVAELADELQRRQSGEEPGGPSVYVLLYGLQRYRILRKTEDSFSFSSSDEEKKPQPDKLFADLLREGPGLGIHFVIWSDTPANVERTLDRAALREFDNRILFQMSASDSSNLIDSPNANKLGQNRALAYSEEQGVMEKFRPYALPDDAYLSHVRSRLSAKTPAPQRA